MFLLILAGCVTSREAESIKVTGLKCEYQSVPLGIDVPLPLLSWILKSTVRGDKQTDYQILVAGNPELLKSNTADMWDSGKVNSDRSVGVLYGGKPLKSGMRVWWKVRAWDKDGNPGPYSEPVWWEMALLSRQDWHGKWICQNKPLPQKEEDFYSENPAPLLRKSFKVERQIKRARAYISGLGYYELRINGSKVGDHMLDPGWTSYAKRVLYSTYDVTDMLKKGENAVGVMLGNGWYNPLPLRMWGKVNPRESLTVGRPRLILNLNIEYADGSTEHVVSDETWRTADGPILKNSVYLGEVYDARKEMQGWDQPCFDDQQWQAAVAALEPVGELRAQSAPPIKIGRIIKPVKMNEPVPGTFIFDLGENFAGCIRLHVKGQQGDTVTLTCGELLTPDGKLNANTSACGQIKAGRAKGGPGSPTNAFHRYTYILKGTGEETYTPRFTYGGFRYVEMVGYPGRPALDAIEGLALHSAVETTGSFSCSNEMFNRIQEAFRRTFLSNIFSVESDCPHREKFGYGGDIVGCNEAAIYNFDMSSFYAKAVYDLADAVRPNGGFTETAPCVGIADCGFGEGSGPMLWGSAHPVLQKRLLQYYGNHRILADQYESTRRWFDFLASKAQDHILSQCIGDHESLVPKSPAVSSTAYYYFTVNLYREICEVLGKMDDARRYATLAGQIKEAFNRKFLDEKTGRCEKGTQANQSFALALGLVPDQQRAATIDLLVDDVLNKHNGHLSTGIFGTDCMLHALSELGRADVAYTIVNQKTFPGWGYMLENGATTLWEHWALDSNTFSHNHPMFGSVSTWFFKYLGGIRSVPDAVGFDRIIIAPQIVGDLKWVKASYTSVHGVVGSEWALDGRRLTLNVTIPVNTTASVHVPATVTSMIKEGNRPVSESNGVKLLRRGEETAVFEVGSGNYRFVVE
ncbi:MAG: hypothetical protein A2283_21210 [Lentisphaerae bacterium RIFOXYA12_FULL_48_11]|nr:MAG: hypothetical protein A2283_21210 [Lentisphaerae bacterium RIFOXYA12_FULL_48_11]